MGVEAVIEGCTKLEMFDVSQCKNLQRWLDGGGVERARLRRERSRGRGGLGGIGLAGKRLRFETKKLSGREASLR